VGNHQNIKPICGLQRVSTARFRRHCRTASSAPAPRCSRPARHQALQRATSTLAAVFTSGSRPSVSVSMWRLRPHQLVRAITGCFTIQRRVARGLVQGSNKRDRGRRNDDAALVFDRVSWAPTSRRIKVSFHPYWTQATEQYKQNA
jgi:hypothetical protein